MGPHFGDMKKLDVANVTGKFWRDFPEKNRA